MRQERSRGGVAKLPFELARATQEEKKKTKTWPSRTGRRWSRSSRRGCRNPCDGGHAYVDIKYNTIFSFSSSLFTQQMADFGEVKRCFPFTRLLTVCASACSCPPCMPHLTRHRFRLHFLLQLVLVLGDIHIPSRKDEIPPEFNNLLQPGKIHHVLCTGNRNPFYLCYLRSLACFAAMTRLLLMACLLLHGSGNIVSKSMDDYLRTISNSVHIVKVTRKCVRPY